MNILSYFTLSNLWSLFTLVLDIGIIAVAIYFCLKIVKNNSRTIQIFKGILFIFILNGLAQLLSLKTIEYFSSMFLNWGILAIVIIFQPEIRSLLEKIGKTTVFTRFSALTVNEKEHLVEELVKTSVALSRTKTGAIISIEQGQSLSDFIKTGTAMNSDVSSELLCSIFQYGTPLHDGAVIIQGDKIACASAYFPPTVKDFPSSYGARHRAAVGISEINDCITIVVSEESGNISVAKEGVITVMNEEELREFLLNTICQSKNERMKEKDNEVSNDSTLKDVLGDTSIKKKNKFRNRKHKYGKVKVEEQEDKIEVAEINFVSSNDETSLQGEEGSDK